MFVRFVLIVSSLSFALSSAWAQTNVLKAFSSPNPVSALMVDNQGCTLIRPLYAQSNTANQINEASLGNLTVPLRLDNATIIDVGGGPSFCRVKDYLPPMSDPNKKLPFEFGVSYRNDATASLTAKLGTWLTLADFTAKDLNTTKVGFEGDTLTYGDDDLGEAYADVQKNKPLCPALKMPSAEIVSRNCVGYIYVALEATREISLNALDFKFAALTVGLNVDWIRQINGTLQQCPAQPPAGTASRPGAGTPAAGTPAAGTPAAGTPAAGTPAAGKPAAGKPAAGTPVAGTPAAGTPAAGTPAAGTQRAPAAGAGSASSKNGFSVSVQTPKGTVKIDPSGFQLTLPSGVKDQPPSASSSTPSTPAQSNAPQKSASQPPAGDTTCVQSVLYRTAVPVIYGIGLKSAAGAKSYAKQK